MQETRKRKRELSDGLPAIPEIHTRGDFGQLGLGNLLDTEDGDSEVQKPRPSPVGPGKGRKVRQVAAGGMHSAVLTADGEVYTAGVNDEAALGRKTDSEVWSGSDLPCAAGDAQSWGRVQIPVDHGHVLEISAGDSHTAALTSTGAVWVWGCFRGSSGPFGLLPGLRFGLVPALAYAPDSQKDQVTAISSGNDHILALRRDGSVLSWGYGEQGQLGRVGRRLNVPERAMLRPSVVPLHKVKGNTSRRVFRAASIAASAYGSFIVDTSGLVAAFGVNASGQLGLPVQGTTVEHSVVERPTLVSALSGRRVSSIGAGKAHSLALTPHGSALSFGLQTYGRLGRRDADPRSDAPLPPAPVHGLDGVNVAAVVAGHDTSAIVTAEGAAYVWGMGSNYQLAKASDADDLVPRKLDAALFGSGRQRALQISYGGQHTLFLVERS